jgi:hypothetical protein
MTPKFSNTCSAFSRVNLGQLPKLHFPMFDGDHPKLLQSRCENYFEMYSVNPSVWVRVTVMHFDDSAAHWLQSVNRRIRTVTWTELCSWIHNRFGRDQHESLIRQLFHIKHMTSVQEYTTQFTELIDQLLAYEPAADQRYYMACFIDGLKDEIKSVILVQCPMDLDTACTLALLQEEAEAACHRDYHRSDSGFKTRPNNMANALLLPLPPVKSDTQLGGAPAHEQWITAVAKATSSDDKVVALHAYRRVKGLCQFCAEKWARGHKCNTPCL